jgi:AraC-like DNA-binding protein
LISKCNNMVQNRRRLQERFLKQTEDAPVTLATNKLDQDLLQKATDIVTKYIDDSNFDVTKFASEMALGRSKLYIKLKGITGMTPNDFIQNIRLKAAANMLKNDLDLNVSDITYRLGFNTPRYFSKCFKDLFGMSPMRYRRQFNPHSEDVIDEDLDD